MLRKAPYLYSQNRRLVVRRHVERRRRANTREEGAPTPKDGR
jgi:hypothetical protein